MRDPWLRVLIRVLIADDHAIVRDGLRHLIDGQEDMQVEEMASDGEAALALALEADVDCMLLDLSLPKLPGIEVLRQLHAKRPDLPVVVLSMYPEDHLALHLYAIGAKAYVSKERDPRIVLDAIRAAAKGEVFETPELVSLRRNSLSDTERVPHETLTAREHQVFILLIEGQSVSAIAATLDLSVSTVSNHLAQIRTKLSVETVVDIVNYAHRVGLVRH
ncbi:MAG: response regulator transcription factor [Myxococcota bacterium]